MTFSILLPFKRHSDKQSKGTLATRLRKDVYPIMREMGFFTTRTNKNRSGKFPVYYMRRRGGVVDVIYFYWFRYGEPCFRIEFGIYDPCEFDSSWFEISRVHIPCYAVRRWRWVGRARVDENFALPWRSYYFYREGIVDKIIQDAIIRLEDVDRYMLRGEPSKNLFSADELDVVRVRDPSSPIPFHD